MVNDEHFLLLSSLTVPVMRSSVMMTHTQWVKRIWPFMLLLLVPFFPFAASSPASRPRVRRQVSSQLTAIVHVVSQFHRYFATLFCVSDCPASSIVPLHSLAHVDAAVSVYRACWLFMCPILTLILRSGVLAGVLAAILVAKIAAHTAKRQKRLQRNKSAE